MKITLIVAHDKNGAIGKDGDLPWHLPKDLKWFKKKTLHKPIVMGRTTWESLSIQPLPKRLNIVMTTQSKYKANGAVVCHSLQDVLTIALAKKADELMITGGGEIYKLFYPLADEMIITKVNTSIDGADTHFVEYPEKDWFVDFSEQHTADEKHQFSYEFQILKRVIK